MVENCPPCLRCMKVLISQLQKAERKAEKEKERQLSGVCTAAAVSASVGDRQDSICLPDTSAHQTLNHHSCPSIADIQSNKQTNTLAICMRPKWHGK